MPVRRWIAFTLEKLVSCALVWILHRAAAQDMRRPKWIKMADNEEDGFRQPSGTSLEGWQRGRGLISSNFWWWWEFW